MVNKLNFQGVSEMHWLCKLVKDISSHVFMMFLSVSVGTLVGSPFGTPLWARESCRYPHTSLDLLSFMTVYIEASGNEKHIEKATEEEGNCSSPSQDNSRL